jgi:hypothetical protein
MITSETAATWMLVVPALPPALAVFLALFGPRILDHLTALKPDRTLEDLKFMLVAVCWSFSVAVGCVVLLIDGVLIIKGFVSFGQWRVLASGILAAVDVLLPIVVLALFAAAFRGLMKML